jgi:NAD(P)-dependent dehydrogenase (short-subunit alcohol dehydrogenase family)
VNLVIAARRREKLVKVAENLTAEYDFKVVPVQTDVSQEDQVVDMVKTIDRSDDLRGRRMDGALEVSTQSSIKKWECSLSGLPASSSF